MTRVNLSIPLRTASGNGFVTRAGAPQRQLLGHPVGLRVEASNAYLELRDVPAEAAAELLGKVRAIIPWAALRLDFGILSAQGKLRLADGAIFDGQFATAYPAHLTPTPVRVAASLRVVEGEARFVSALIEGSQLRPLTGSSGQPELKLCCEMFALVDFEASETARLLALVTILEIMAKPAPRPKPCLDIIEEAMARMVSEAEAAEDPALRQALLDMHKGATHWRAESIRSSVRRLAVDAARALGDGHPEVAGKSAVRLYDKRSSIVHEGQVASAAEARDARRIVREVLAVAAGGHHRIRERFPTS